MSGLPSSEAAAPAGASPGASSSPPALPPPRLTLIGAGHVFAIRETVRGAIEALRPDVVFIELDRGRLQALLQRDQARGQADGARGTGKQAPATEGFVHRRLARFQEEVASMYGAEVGGEMLGAVDGARIVGARLALVDDDAGAALARVRSEMPLGEKLRFGATLAGGALRQLVPGRRGKGPHDIEGELARYQEDPAAVLAELGGKFPTLHRILIAERNTVMAGRIRAAMASARNGVAILGDGHVGGMQALLADLQPRVYRLADVREGRLPRMWHATGTASTLRFWLRSHPVAPA